MNIKDLQQLLATGYSVHFDAIDKKFVQVRVMKRTTHSQFSQTKNIIDLERSEVHLHAVSEIEVNELPKPPTPDHAQPNTAKSSML